MSFSLDLAVNALAFDTVTRRRGAAGAYVSGDWAPGAEASVDIQASITPLPDRELQRLTDGQRTRGGIRVITTADLRTSDRAAGVPADRLTFRSRVYEVVRAGDWTTFGFLDAVAAEVEP